MDIRLIAALAIAFILNTVEALECSTCEWAKTSLIQIGEKDCKEKEDPAKTDFLEPCPDATSMGPDYEARCMIKDVEYKLLTLKTETVSRGCAIVKKTMPNGCSTKSSSEQWKGVENDALGLVTGMKGNICYCNAYKCNAAGHVTISMAAILMSCILGLLFR